MHDSAAIPSERRALIAARLAGGSAVSAAQLALEFGLSEDAIRRDLRALAGQGLCRRVYGGAMPPPPADPPPADPSPAALPFAARAARGAAAKAALARAAAGLIRPGMVLFLDTGSTVLHLARALPRDLGLQVVTNAVASAAALAPRADLTLHVIGGRADPQTGGCHDARALAEIGRFRFDLCFLGACALSRDEGLAGFDAGDVDCKRAALSASRDSALMLTADKIDTFAPHVIAPLSAIGHYLLEPPAPPDLPSLLLAAGAHVTLAPPDQTHAD